MTKNKKNLKIYSTTFLAALMLGAIGSNNINLENQINNFGLVTVANANSNIRYVKLNNTSSRLNFRKNPTKSATVLAKLEHGEVVYVNTSKTATANGVNWIQCTVNGKTGWVDKSKLVTSCPTITVGTAISGTVYKQVTVSNNGNLNVRTSTATKTNNIVGKLKNGDVVQVTRETAQWYKIKKGDLEGWANKTYLKDTTTSKNGVINTWAHKDDETEIKIEQVRKYDSDAYIAHVKIQRGVQFKHVYASNEFDGTLKTVQEITKHYSPILAINAGGWYVKDKSPYGTFGSTGKVNRFVATEESLMMDYDGRLSVVKPKTKAELESLKPFWVATFGPTLVENNKNVITYDANEAVHPRTAIGQTDNPNEFVIIVVDGRSKTSRGVTLYELANIFKENGVKIAYNLDGGGSSTLVFKGKVINKPSDANGPRKVISSLFIRNVN